MGDFDTGVVSIRFVVIIGTVDTVDIFGISGGLEVAVALVMVVLSVTGTAADQDVFSVKTVDLDKGAVVVSACAVPDAGESVIDTFFVIVLQSVVAEEERDGMCVLGAK